MRATHGNKFIRHLSDDIVTENHHLKNQIVQMRKVLKNYEDVMVQQLVKLAKDQKLDQTEGFFFETPQQYLRYFVQMVSNNIHKNAQLQYQNRHSAIECQQLKLDNSIKQKKISQFTQSQRVQLTKITELQAIKQNLEKELSEIKITYTNNNKLLKTEIFQLKQELGRIQNQYKIKFLQQKKLLVQKSNKDLAKAKAQMEIEISQKEKAIKYEHDKRDRQFKNLFTTINSFISRSQSRQAKSRAPNINLTSSFNLGLIRKQSLTVDPVQQQKLVGASLNELSIELLKQAIKPFSEHSILLQKLSDCRKENLQLRTQLRQLSTNLSTIKAQLDDKQNEFNLEMEKYSNLKVKHHEMHDQLINAREQLHNNLQDKQNMEKYYSQRWNTEINKVKYNIQKKCETQMKNLDQEYKQLRSSLQIERHQLRQQALTIIEQCNILKQSNRVLIQENSKLTLEKTELIKTIALRDRLLKQVEAMHNQDLLSTRMLLAEGSKHYLKVISENKQIIKSRDQQIIQMRQQFRQNMTVLRDSMNEEIAKQVNQVEKLHEQQMSKKNQQIGILTKDIQSHRSIIITYQMEESNRAEVAKVNFTKEKDRELRQIKVGHFEQITKLNEKIHKLEQRVKSLRSEMNEKMDQNIKQLIQKERQIKENKYKITQLQQKISMHLSEQKKLKKEVQMIQSAMAIQRQQTESVLIQMKSIRMILKQREDQIQTLVHDKNTWLNNLLQCRKQFEKGFKDLKKINDNKVAHYQSRIWQLQRICEDGGMSQKDYQKIRSLTQEKKKLIDEVAMKEAEILVLTQVKTYYENKSKNLDGKLMTKYAFNQEKKPIPILARKPRRKSNLKNLRTEIREDIGDFTGSQAVEIKKYNESARNASMKSQAQLASTFYKQFRANTRTNSRSKARVNSSLM